MAQQSLPHSGHIWFMTEHSPADRLTGDWPMFAACDSVNVLKECGPTPPDTWLPHGLHSGLARLGLRPTLPTGGLLQSYGPLTLPFCKAGAEVRSRCSAETRGCWSSSSDIANTGTLMWSPSPGNSRLFTTWPLSIWRWVEEGELELGSDGGPGVTPDPFGGSFVSERRPKQGPVNRERRRLLVELRRRCLCECCVSG